MSYSLNEVEALAKKATRGAGYSWGLAEEAGKAARFICAQGLDGCAALADVLGAFDRRPPRPVFGNGAWSGVGGALCPITLGAALNDHATPDGFSACTCRDVRQPALLLFHAAQIARVTQRSVTLAFEAGTVITDGVAVGLSGQLGDHAKVLRVSAGGKIVDPLQKTHRSHPDPGIWESLNTFAHRTYAPATEESRVKGAG